MSGDDETTMDTEEAVRLVSAAIGYSLLTLKEVADKTGINKDTLRNYSSRSRPTRPTLEIRLKIARATGFPEWAMVSGLSSPREERGAQIDVRRFELLEENFEHLAAQVAALVAEALRRTGESLPSSERPLPRMQPE